MKVRVSASECESVCRIVQNMGRVWFLLVVVVDGSGRGGGCGGRACVWVCTSCLRGCVCVRANAHGMRGCLCVLAVVTKKNGLELCTNIEIEDQRLS